jgi:hypothetical protein
MQRNLHRQRYALERWPMNIPQLEFTFVDGFAGEKDLL